MGSYGRRGGYNPYEHGVASESASSYIDISAPRITHTIEDLHEALAELKKIRPLENTYFQNCLLTLTPKASDIRPGDYAAILERRYGLDADSSKVITALRAVRMNTPEDRSKMMQWACNTVELFTNLLSGDSRKYEEFIQLFNKVPVAEAYVVRERIFVIALYSVHEELDSFNDIHLLLNNGTNEFFNKYFVRIMESLNQRFGYPVYEPIEAPRRNRNSERSDRLPQRDEMPKPKQPDRKPLDISNPSLKQIIEETHESFSEWAPSIPKRDDLLVANRLFMLVLENNTMDLPVYANLLNKKYGWKLDAGIIREVFFKHKMFYDRAPLIAWCNTAADLFVGALQGNKEKYAQLTEHLKTNALSKGPRHFCQERMTALKVFMMHPELDVYNDWDLLYSIGNNIYSRNYFDGMLDAICKVYGFPACNYFGASAPRKAEKAAPRLTQEQALLRIEQLQVKLDRTNLMLKDLQDDFDQQLSESKVTALTDFFAKLNSDRYGNILDMVLQLRKGVTRLAKSGYELPEDLNGLFVMYNKLVQFIRDAHIDPIRKPGSQANVTASDIEFCDYEGTPFVTEDEVKLVETVSPGWVYKDQNVQISRPKVKEVISEAELTEEPITTETAVTEENDTSAEDKETEETTASPAINEEATPTEDAIVEEQQTPISDSATDEEVALIEKPIIEDEQVSNIDSVTSDEITQDEATTVEDDQAPVNDSIVDEKVALEGDSTDNTEESPAVIDTQEKQNEAET